jgi:1,2-diacylglycerol 3-beta-galactosyltransferase
VLEPLLAAKPPAQVAAITGRNERLREELESRTWPQPLRVTGFVENMHVWMAAADLLVTKAGPGTMAEALVVGVPMVLCGAVPGQEPPNVRYAVESGAALWAPEPARAAKTAHQLLWDRRGTLKEMRRRAELAGHPDAARGAAGSIWGAIWGSRSGCPGVDAGITIGPTDRP